jgi:hypothetical protein
VEVAQILKIKNPNTAPVAFKVLPGSIQSTMLFLRSSDGYPLQVKTTAPKQYVFSAKRTSAPLCFAKTLVQVLRPPKFGSHRART